MKRALGASFVVTISAAAASACSGKLEEDELGVHATIDAGRDAEQDAAADSGPSSCPSALPKSGAACSGPTHCDYGARVPASCGGGFSEFADCVNGKWSVGAVTDCNPPPAKCPSVQPVSGTACPSEGQLCSYSNGPCPANQSICAKGVWQSVTATCNPPPPDAGH